MSEMPTVDCLIVTPEERVVLVWRGKDPFRGKLVLPGGHIEPGEIEEQACRREVLEETGLVVNGDIQRFVVLDSPNRDSRPGHNCSLVFVAQLADEYVDSASKAGSDATEVITMSLSDITSEHMGFDHWEAIQLLRKRRQK